ncbi:MAG: trypsin-like peptidase domain-containing protein [Acidobacteriia bacterium]|nr:trypsin-like peptidase domain-containing protein [Terriglobia bacterium]
MNNTREKIVIIEADAASRESLRAAMQEAGYDVSAFAGAHEGLAAVRQSGADVLLLGAVASDPGAPSVHETVAAIRGSAMTEGVRVILLTVPGAEERAAGLDLGADDAVSRPWDAVELVARVRAQLRVRRMDNDLLEKTRLAEEGQQIAHTAFDALAVTEKLSSDAESLDRRLKLGLGAILIVAAVMAGIYFLFVRHTQVDMQRTTATITRLEGGLIHQQNLMADARKLREGQVAPGESPAGGETDSVENFISADVQSVCLLHVSVAFRNQQTGQRLRYAGLNQQGEPLQDSEGNPVLTLEGRGPEVIVDVFGTGFPAGGEGRVVTNRHVAEPWWNNDELSDLTSQGFQAEISSIRAYFPGDPRSFKAEIQNVSKDADLATMRIDMQNLKRPALSIDSGKGAAVTGEPVILMGYATGLAGILARTDEDTAQKILVHSGGDVSQIMDELARRNLIRPIITQGHIGDVLPDKIVFDAQTTSGGSGGPLFNQQGKVIGVTYAVLSGFGGSNFGIPIRFSEPLLAPAAARPAN